MPVFPKPHYSKLEACLENRRLSQEDREKVEEARERYREWINSLESVVPGEPDAVEKMVAATNQYKRFIEVDLIRDLSLLASKQKTDQERRTATEGHPASAPMADRRSQQNNPVNKQIKKYSKQNMFQQGTMMVPIISINYYIFLHKEPKHYP